MTARNDMPLEAFAGIQLFLYGVGWTVAAALIGDQRAVLAHWAAYALGQAASVVLAAHALSVSSDTPSAALVVSVVSFAAALRGVDLFAGGVQLDRWQGSCLATGLSAIVALHAWPGLPAPLVGRASQISYAATSAAILLGTAPSLWRRLRERLPRPVVAMALLPGVVVGAVALVSLAVGLLYGEHQAEIRGIAHSPNVVASLVVSAIFNFGFLFLFMARLLARQRELARLDYLTGVLNRRATDERLALAWEQHARTGEPLAVALVDLDHFKAINDAHGHAAGDVALQFAANTLLAATRPYDAVGRWGGEEFLVVMPSTGVEAANSAAERFRRLLQGSSVPALHHALTASIGVSVATGATDTPQALVAAADRALYAAKNAGRNLCAFADEEGTVPGFPVPHIVDTVGAGDGFAAGVVSARLEGLDWPSALARGNWVGAQVIQMPGDIDGLPRRPLPDFK
jgi:diguanylate cyclase (GGDEF)-like protein